MAQMLLFPDPRPLVERLGPEFFRQAPESPGVYLMRGRADTVLYVGKAKNLRKRLASYRVANPDRMRRRHLKLLRAVERIELQPCASESSALAKESALLRSLRPRFNRAGTWPGTSWFLVWQVTNKGVELALKTTSEPQWQGTYLPGPTASALFSALARLLWCAFHPEKGFAEMPEGWFRGRRRESSIIPCPTSAATLTDDPLVLLKNLFDGETTKFAEWIRRRTSSLTHPFELTVREADLETLTEFAKRTAARERGNVDT